VLLAADAAQNAQEQSARWVSSLHTAPVCTPAEHQFVTAPCDSGLMGIITLLISLLRNLLHAA
jgi:hypothetical protein